VDPSRHWEGIYSTRAPEDVGWFEPDPVTSRRLIAKAVEDGAQSVIDIGGGASRLVDHLLDLRFERLAVLDLSEAGLNLTKDRLGAKAEQVEWIVGDVTRIEDIGQFDVWHDRALFHFLITPPERERYVRLAEQTLRPGGTAIMGTFASDGPERCSGLTVCRYDPDDLAATCGPGFERMHSERHVHITPMGVPQSFVYSSFRRYGPRLMPFSKKPSQ